MDKKKIEEILCQQIELLAEASKNSYPEELTKLTNAMSNLYLALLQGSIY